MNLQDKLLRAIYSILFIFSCILLTACPKDVDIDIIFRNETSSNFEDLTIIWPANTDQFEDYVLFSGNLQAKSSTKQIKKSRVPSEQVIQYKVNGTSYEIQTESLHPVLRESAKVTYLLSFTNPANPESLKVTAEILLED